MGNFARKTVLIVCSSSQTSLYRTVSAFWAQAVAAIYIPYYITKHNHTKNNFYFRFPRSVRPELHICAPWFFLSYRRYIYHLLTYLPNLEILEVLHQLLHASSGSCHATINPNFHDSVHRVPPAWPETSNLTEFRIFGTPMPTLLVATLNDLERRSL